MRRIFADSFFFIALLNARDASHVEVSRWYRETTGVAYLTTEAVLMEVADALSHPNIRLATARLLRGLPTFKATEVVPGDTKLFAEGLDLYQARSDKHWSLTDCISFVVMDREGVTEALTGDRHFAQAGFQPLFLT